jgi:hypothetical protein
MANNQEATDTEPHQTILTTGHPARRIDYRYVRNHARGTSERPAGDVRPER